ncbi:MAG: fatty acid desaturase [Deltaproteobacteria bacterium]|nr:fatty acid desaturase [Deltaproteobacteria bacterium]
MGEFAARHKHALTWLHIGVVAGTVGVVVPMIAWSGGLTPTLSRAGLIFALATVAWCQNIGLVHHFAHHLPYGPRRLGLATARLLHALGGLAFTPTRLAHRLHHAHLGTARDPDRLGYESTTTVRRRLRYLLLIGPLRARFAPVDVAPALAAMAPQRRAAYERRCRADRRLVLVAQAALLVLSGVYYPVVVAALLAANVLSNLREMAEHGDHGRAAYVDVRVSPLGVLLLSTPGFWFHGIHHMDPTIHYLELPRAARRVPRNCNLRYVQRASAVAYLFTGR